MCAALQSVCCFNSLHQKPEQVVSLTKSTQTSFGGWGGGSVTLRLGPLLLTLKMQQIYIFILLQLGNYGIRVCVMGHMKQPHALAVSE